MSEPSVATFKPGTDPTLYSNKVDQQSFTVLYSTTAIASTIVTTATISTITAPQYLLNVNTGEIIYAEGVSSNSFTSCIRGAGDSTAAAITSRDILVPVHTGNEWNQLVREIIAITDYISKLDWRPVTDSWTYASASTINTPTGATTIYEKGDKIRLKQGGSYKYFYVTNVASTLLTVTGGIDYTVANAGITDIYYSKAASPVGFPQAFNYTPAITFTAGTAPTSPNAGGRFSIVGGGVCILNIYISYANAGATVTGCSIPLPVPSSLTVQPAFGSITVASAINPCHTDISSGTGRITCSSISANRVIFGASYSI